jgi:hypothetical protein
MGKKEDIKQFTKELENLKFDKMYEGDFSWTWENPRRLTRCSPLPTRCETRERNISTKIFDSGSGLPLPDNSTRTRFSFASLKPVARRQDLDEARARLRPAKPSAKRQHDSFMRDVWHPRRYVHRQRQRTCTRSRLVKQGNSRRARTEADAGPLQCDLDHPNSAWPTGSLLRELGDVKPSRARRSP